jgi:transcriptional regulator with XRE-family HTH domain
MFANALHGRGEYAKELRRECGLWLRRLREAAGLTQVQLAQRLSYEYYTFVSQIEGGKGRVPPEQYATWANAVGVDPAWFVKNLMRYYDPYAYRLLWPEEERS